MNAQEQEQRSPQEAATPAPAAFFRGAIVLIPALNEGAVIGAVVASVRANYDLPVVVIDDASTDDTAERARAAGAMVLPLVEKLGAWGAMQTGIRYARNHGYRYAITMDADGQHEVASLVDLVPPVLNGDANVAIGSCTARGSRMRLLAWRMLKRVSGLSLDDVTSGYRVYDHKALDLLCRWEATLLSYQDVGVLLLLQSRGLTIIDVPVSMQPRSHGKSRVFNSWATVVYYMCHTLLLGLSKRRMVRTGTPETEDRD